MAKENELLAEIKEIKKLLVLIALKNKASQAEVGKVLGISDRRVRELVTGK
jgi:DNA-directed RNA polymerase specialized sigma subunit